ncbi:MAG: type II secretion system protein [Betaproteobacteria bacterium]
MARRPARGFALIELLISVVILGLLAGGAMTFAALARQRNDEQELRAGLREIRQAIDAYKRASDDKRIARAADETGYPRSLSELVDGVTDIANPKAAKIHFLRRLPRDPLADPTLAAEATWGLRSYASAADNPQEGRDVFDVYSKSLRQGLNGQPYGKW